MIKSPAFTSLCNILNHLMPHSFDELLRALTELLYLSRDVIAGFQRPKGLYKVLDYRATLELLDARGREAIYEKRERVHFLQDCATAFYDYGWGDGQAFASHRVRPGHIVDRQRLGPRFRSLIELPNPKRKGDKFSFQVRRRMENAFREQQEWLDVEVYHATRRLELLVVFPVERRARRAWGVGQRSQVRVELGLDRRLPDGRQAVRYQVNKPEIGERYTFAWEW